MGKEVIKFHHVADDHADVDFHGQTEAEDQLERFSNIQETPFIDRVSPAAGDRVTPISLRLLPCAGNFSVPPAIDVPNRTKLDRENG